MFGTSVLQGPQGNDERIDLCDGPSRVLCFGDVRQAVRDPTFSQRQALLGQFVPVGSDELSEFLGLHTGPDMAARQAATEV